MKTKKMINDEELKTLFDNAKPVDQIPEDTDSRIVDMIRAKTSPVKDSRYGMFRGFSGIRIPAIAAAVAVCFVCAGIFLGGYFRMNSDTSKGITVNGKGDFFIIRNGVKIGKSAMSLLQRGDILTTGRDGILRLSYSGGIVVLAHSSSLRIDDIAINGAVLFLASLNDGSVAVQSEKLEKGSSVRIRTRDADVAVRGTKFLVSSDESSGTHVAVSEGKVLLNSAYNSPVVVDSHDKVTINGQRLLRSVTSNEDSAAMDSLLNEKMGKVMRVKSSSFEDKRIVNRYTRVLHSDVMWERTGITIHEGDIVTVSAEGLVTLWSIVGAKSADGVDLQHNGGRLICNNIRFGALLLRIDGKIYPVGSHDVFSATHSGEIEMSVNDTYGGFSDNVGTLDVSIVVREEKKGAFKNEDRNR